MQDIRERLGKPRIRERSWRIGVATSGNLRHRPNSSHHVRRSNTFGNISAKAFQLSSKLGGVPPTGRMTFPNRLWTANTRPRCAGPVPMSHFNPCHIESALPLYIIEHAPPSKIMRQTTTRAATCITTGPSSNARHPRATGHAKNPREIVA